MTSRETQDAKSLKASAAFRSLKASTACYNYNNSNNNNDSTTDKHTNNDNTNANKKRDPVRLTHISAENKPGGGHARREQHSVRGNVGEGHFWRKPISAETSFRRRSHTFN